MIYSTETSNKQAVRAAMERIADQNRQDYFTGGMDVLKEWQSQRTGPKHKHRPPGYITDGFSIMRRWQREHGTAKKEAPSEAFEGGFDIMKKWQREHSGKK